MIKLVVWDFDHTLVQSILQEDKDPPFSTLIHGVRFLKELGIPSIICSQNLESDLIEFLNKHQLTPLFVGVVANLEINKGEALYDLQKLFNISKGEDILFVDDDPVRLSQVQAMNLGYNTSLPHSFFQEWFPVILQETTYPVSQRSLDRVAHYKSEWDRHQSQVGYGDNSKDFLKSLGLKVEVRLVNPEDFPQIIELLTRANQYLTINHRNFKTREAVFQSLNPESLTKSEVIWVCEAEDKFGVYGLCGALWMTINPTLNSGEIQFLVMSCRVQGRGIASYFLYQIFQLYQMNLEFNWEATEYNRNMKNLWQWWQFEILGEDIITVRGNSELFYNHSDKCPDWINV